MQKIFKRFLSFCLAVALCLGTVAIFGATQQYTVAEAATDYYAGITAQSGTALSGQLHDLIVDTHKTYTSYDDCKKYGPTTDPGLDGRGVVEFYTHETVMSFSGTKGTWNREHVWCQSLSKSGGNGTQLWGTSGGGSDLHHIRPSEGSLNGTRSSNKYGVVTNGTPAYSKTTSGSNSELGGYVGGGAFEPLDNVKGDVARIVMYVYLHYNNASNVGGTKESKMTHGDLPFTNVMKASNEAAAINLLLEWNKSDPVDQIELYRNEEVYKLQGNRNPFIDNSSYADAIWGNGSVIDPGPGIDPQPSGTLKSISLSASALNLSVGDTHTLTVTPNPSNASASVIWSSSDTSVATVSGGKVVAVSAGTATITATSSVNTSIKATATVTVRESSSSETGISKVTITRKSFTASGGYGVYSWTSGSVGGSGYIYGGNNDAIQFNTSKASQYIASSKTKGVINKIKIEGSGNSSWTLLTSTQPYNVSSNPSNGNAQTEDTANSGTWTVSGNDTYFALVLGGGGAGYINSIEVEYSTGDSPDPSKELEELYINPSQFELKAGASTALTVSSVPSTASAQVTWTSSNPSVATVSADGKVTAVKAGTATITATSTVNSSIKATATVTVTADEPIVIVGSQTAQAFHNAVAAIDGDGTLKVWHATINAAVEAYKKLTAADKTEVSADIETLKSEIASYNEKIKAYNGAADAADEPALNGAGRFV